MSALLALLSSVMWGVSDFVGGAASRRSGALRLTALSNPFGVVPLVFFTFLVPGSLSSGAWWTGIASGIAGTFGILLLYVVLAAGPMGVMSPLTAVVSAVVPVMFGLLRGERPGGVAYVGMVLAVVAIVLVSVERPGPTATGQLAVQPRIVALAVLSGVFIGLYLGFIGIAPSNSGTWPVLIARVVSSLIIVPIALVRLRGGFLAVSLLLPAAVMGVLDATANAFYRISAQSGTLAVVAVLVALYPAATVLLARFVLHERLRGIQITGLVLALTAAVLLTLP